MTIAEQKRLLTEDELMALGSDARVEIVDGEVVELQGHGGLHHLIAGNVYDLLKRYVREQRGGLVFTHGLIYLMFREGEGLRGARVPDVSYIQKADIPKTWDAVRPFPGTPTLAIEVVSPDDDPNDLLKKIREYLEAGSAQVWVIYPQQEEVHQYIQGDANIRTYSGDDSLDAEALFPGLALPLSAVFEPLDLELDE